MMSKYIAKLFKTHKEAVNNFKADCVFFTKMEIGVDQIRQHLELRGPDFTIRYASEERVDAMRGTKNDLVMVHGDVSPEYMNEVIAPSLFSTKGEIVYLPHQRVY